MNINFSAEAKKSTVFSQVETYLKEQGFLITESDENRPWGGFFVIDENQSAKFIDIFLRGIPEASPKGLEKISPKILIVEPGKRLSWQYHHRRSEVWKVIGGEAAVVRSDTDKENPEENKKVNDVIILKQGERHRLVGTNQWGIIAEIWQHTDAAHPSDENDIIRVEDDFGR